MRERDSRWEYIVSDNADGWHAYNVGDQRLTKREAEIAGLVSQGLANKVVAGLLGVREGTVKIHLHSIYRKLRVANRTGLALSAIATRR
jgi:DNA-binding NarL/FixJ family response regulator